ncbi:CD209 antigen-like protein C isoform X2 [Periophthalmus magnuspinnatus]|uniref:CD209 antigen-like protein C isoform X2 n=1 Tax=Periophthalmus magnuspinnatus TaxID=409849 RepID=UPI0024366B9C|nr:CD209 antigen-like protein C isoform X2 [Periophthalmus magnuspinnatus]
MMECRVDTKRNRSNSGSVTDSQTATEPGKWILLVGISFGLLCIIQASLNVYFRLYHPPNIDKSTYDNVTAEMDALGKLLQTRRQDLSKQKDELQKSHSSQETCEQTLTQEREKLKKTLSILEARELEITEERDKLKLKLQAIDNYTSEGWLYFQGSVYLGSTTEQTWQESRQYCQQRGADLTIISSVQEQKFAHSTFKGRRWIGLSDLEQEGLWKWVDGSLVRTRFWMRGEPNNLNNEDCGELNFNSDLKNWNDHPCTNRKLCICEKRLA